ncbi:MAG: NUDIX domain-containing protein [Patescibacteria group bacterium]
MKKEKGIYQVSLKLLLKNDKNEVLILKAADNGSYAGYYDLPGGRIDANEFEVDFLEIIKREIKEEIGEIEFNIHSKPVAVGRHLIPASMTISGKDIQVLYLFFEAEYLGGNIKISNEHTDSKWLNLKDVELDKYFTSGILEGIKMYCK